VVSDIAKLLAVPWLPKRDCQAAQETLCNTNWIKSPVYEKIFVFLENRSRTYGSEWEKWGAGVAAGTDGQHAQASDRFTEPAGSGQRRVLCRPGGDLTAEGSRAWKSR
jgi:hypothetical protein